MEFTNKSWNLTRSPEDAEKVIISLFVSTFSRTVEEMVARYGPEALEVARQAFIDSMVIPIKESRIQVENRDLDTFARWLISGVGVGHKGEIVEHTEKSIRFKFTACPYAELFRAAGKQDIGRFFCDADSPLAEAFNCKIKFERTKTLMDGDEYCNHHYFIEE